MLLLAEAATVPALTALDASSGCSAIIFITRRVRCFLNHA